MVSIMHGNHSQACGAAIHGVQLMEMSEWSPVHYLNFTIKGILIC
ncbi:hypothetical protein BRDCF_p743 [Bacteroidales bacterium CF]|nr:hypothetical protein BRDCF_p743 [Bacteroidales bacterium CF]